MQLTDWIGRCETRTDVIAPWPIEALSATLDRDDPAPCPGDPLPPLWHWLYFLPTERQSDLGPDGHPKRGGFLPPVELPLRMWAGGRLKFHEPLRVGEQAARESRVTDIKEKTGKTGPLTFVAVQHKISGPSGLAIVEEHDIVYRGSRSPGADAPEPPSTRAEWQRTIAPDDVLLFRYSALTFNGHRIHYDRRFCMDEGYPGLVVHGPLIATLLLDLVRRNLPDARIVSFQFRAIAPLFDTEPFAVCGKGEGDRIALWAQTVTGRRPRLGMTASAAIHPSVAT